MYETEFIVRFVLKGAVEGLSTDFQTCTFVSMSFYMVALKRAVFVFLLVNLPLLAADASGKLHVLWHDGDALGVDGTKVGVLEETDHP